MPFWVAIVSNSTSANGDESTHQVPAVDGSIPESFSMIPATWLDELNDIQARSRVLVRIERLAAGLTEGVKPVGAGISELRIDYGLGYRVYLNVKVVNLAAYYEATDWLAFGVSYEGEVKQDVEGTYAATLPTGTTMSAGDAGGEVTTPALLRAGASAKVSANVTVNAGITYTMWSSCDELAISFDPYLLGRVPRNATAKDWADVFRYQVGIVSMGVGYAKNKFLCDVGYTYIYMPRQPA